MRDGLRRLASQFLRFGLVGIAGFAVDVGVLYGALRILHAGPYAGRVLSYLAAATSTWFLNRHITFADRRSDAIGREWLSFIALNVVGGVINYATYSVYLSHFGSAGLNPAVGVGLGSLAGMVVNFSLSRKLVFRHGSHS